MTTKAPSIERPKSFGSEENLYSQAIEDAFGDIEHRIAPIQRKLERGETLSTDQRNGWAMWLLASYLRTPLAILHSANANQAVGPFRGDFFRVGNSTLVSLAANPNCIKLIVDRHWEVLISHDPIWLKPDKGVVLTDRLDAEGCLVVYPLSPFACLVAGGRGPSYHASGVSSRRAAGLNRQILRWAERSVVCTASRSAIRDSKLLNEPRDAYCLAPIHAFRATKVGNCSRHKFPKALNPFADAVASSLRLRRAKRRMTSMHRPTIATSARTSVSCSFTRI